MQEVSVVDLQVLREDLPEWSWRAVRCGMSWRYEGERKGKRITLMRQAILCGPCDDDFTSRWMTHETGESYATWYVRERMRIAAESQ